MLYLHPLMGRVASLILLVEVLEQEDTLCMCQICKTLNGRLPTKNASHRRQTWWNSISDDFAHFIFRRRKKVVGREFRRKNVFVVEKFCSGASGPLTI